MLAEILAALDRAAMTTRSRVPAIVLAVAFIALQLAFTEIDRLVSQVGSGFRFSILDVTGITAFSHLDQWLMGHSTNAAEWRVEPFIHLYTVLDALFIAVYAISALLIIRRVFGNGPEGYPARALLLILVAVDMGEDVLLNFAGELVQTPVEVPLRLLQLQAGFSVAKWALVLLVAVAVLRKPGLLRSAGSGLSRVWSGIAVQRLTAFVVLVLLVLSLLPLHPILEQVPDIQRGWLDEGGWLGGLAAVIVLTILAAVFLLVGRATAERNAGSRKPYTGLNYLIWLSIPLVVGVGAFIAYRASAAHDTYLLDLATAQVFLALTLGILAISAVFELIQWLVRRHRTRKSGGDAGALVEVSAGTGDLAVARRTTAVLSALIIALPALGFARSLSTQVLLAAAAPRPDDGEPPLWAQAVSTEKVTVSAVLIVLMLAIAVIVLALATGSRARVDETLTRPMTASRSWRVGASVAAVVLAAILVVLALWPAGIGRLVGPIAVMIAALGAWTGLIGLLSVVLSYRAPLTVFRWAGLRSDPVVALFLIIPILVSQLAGAPTLHAIRSLAGPSSGATTTRDQLGDAFGDWLVRSDGCVGEVLGTDGLPVPIRPLALVAAEGGGIRAAVWTDSVMSELVSAGGCTANSVFLSSGVSGGSVGLAIAANPSWDPDSLADADAAEAEAMAQQLRDDARAVGDSTALATAINGLLIADPIASTTGIRLPSLESSWVWRDRASLIERSWRDAVPLLSSRFDAVAAAPTGLVVLNSTDIRSGCRVVVSQVELGPGASGFTSVGMESTFVAPTATCDSGNDEPALTIDMLDFYEQCGGRGPSWATAALLSARFPFVTPSGTIGNGASKCGPRLQLVDGGYAENSGLGLLADIAPELGRIIRSYNSFDRAEGDPLVVPYVMYVQNSPEPIIEPLGVRDTAELVVPLVGSGAKATQVAPSSWIQRAMASIGELCAPAQPDCATAAESISWSAETTRRVVIAQTDTQPSISVPLGWGLSDASYCQLVLDADAQAGFGSRRPFEFNNSLGNYLRLFPESLSTGSNQDVDCRIDR